MYYKRHVSAPLKWASEEWKLLHSGTLYLNFCHLLKYILGRGFLPGKKTKREMITTIKY